MVVVVIKICYRSAGDRSNLKAYVYKEAAADEVSLLGKIKAAGVAVNTADGAAFVKASSDIYEQFAKEVSGSGELIAKAQSLR